MPLVTLLSSTFLVGNHITSTSTFRKYQAILVGPLIPTPRTEAGGDSAVCVLNWFVYPVNFYSRVDEEGAGDITV